MNVIPARVRPLPVVLPPLRDELLSSWILRHVAFYGVGGGRMLRHGLVAASFPRRLDLSLTRHDQFCLAELFRCDPRSISRMMQSRPGVRPPGLIASARTPHLCRRCLQRHRADELTRGARLRSWMEGWRLACPVCGSDLEDVRLPAAGGKDDNAGAFVARVLLRARQGEALLDRVLRRQWRMSERLTELMRVLLMPRYRSGGLRTANAIPRLLNIVVPGFDEYVREHHPDFRLPGTLLLPITIRTPLLAGVSRVAAQPEQWAEYLLGAAGKQAEKRVWTCLESLSDGQSRDAATSSLKARGGPLGAVPQPSRHSQVTGNGEIRPKLFSA